VTGSAGDGAAPDGAVRAQAVAAPGQALAWSEVRRALHAGLAGRLDGQRVLVLIPDHTRTLPLPELFRDVVELLDGAATLTFMVALGTHPPLDEARLAKLVGISEEERAGRYGRVGIVNHAWDEPGTLVSLGRLPQARIRAIAGDRWHPTLGGDVDVLINRAVPEADHVVILGPTFPHEVVGFSGGYKYYFPGVSGADMINVTHWLGALTGVIDTIGVADTPVRAMIHAAAELVSTPTTLVALTVEGHDLSAIAIGDPVAAWREAAALSHDRHITHLERPMQRVLAVAPPMYDELWTAGKAMYKLEPALAPGAELIILAPHLDTISRVHGRWIEEIGYHTLPHFLHQWERFAHVPLGVLAHSTHVRGAGRWVDGREEPRVRVTLSSRIDAATCARLGLGYLDPAGVDVDAWADRQGEGVLLVRKAGERLYRAPRATL
jgi:lactate racemase